MHFVLTNRPFPERPVTVAATIILSSKGRVGIEDSGVVTGWMSMAVAAGVRAASGSEIENVLHCKSFHRRVRAF